MERTLAISVTGGKRSIFQMYCTRDYYTTDRKREDWREKAALVVARQLLEDTGENLLELVDEGANNLLEALLDALVNVLVILAAIAAVRVRTELERLGAEGQQRIDARAHLHRRHVVGGRLGARIDALHGLGGLLYRRANEVGRHLPEALLEMSGENLMCGDKVAFMHRLVFLLNNIL